MTSTFQPNLHNSNLKENPELYYNLATVLYQTLAQVPPVYHSIPSMALLHNSSPSLQVKSKSLLQLFLCNLHQAAASALQRIILLTWLRQ